MLGGFTDAARNLINQDKDADKIELWDYNKLEEMAVASGIPL